MSDLPLVPSADQFLTFAIALILVFIVMFGGPRLLDALLAFEAKVPDVDPRLPVQST